MDLRRAVLHRLESLERAGVRQLRCAPEPPPEAGNVAPGPESVAATPLAAQSFAAPAGDATTPAVPAPSPRMPVPPLAARPAIPAPAGPTAAMAKNSPRPQRAASKPARFSGEEPTVKRLSLDERRVALEVLNGEVRECRRCPELVGNRTQTVFGVGNLQPRLCFFGEAPGADEDAQGEPFVGRAGQLLDKIIQAMTLRREDVYILNVLKCRPPDNRQPTEDEAEQCRPFFERQLEILQPEFICCLGASAAKTLLHTAVSIGKLRGRFFEFRGARVIATYHPAYLLRNPAAKRDVWLDMQLLMKEMGIPVPP